MIYSELGQCGRVSQSVKSGLTDINVIALVFHSFPIIIIIFLKLFTQNWVSVGKSLSVFGAPGDKDGAIKQQN